MTEDSTLSPVRLVEAALFTAGRPVGVDELVDATGLDTKAAKRAVKALEMDYDEKGDLCAIEVKQAGDKWAMQLKTIYVQHSARLAQMEIPKKTLKTLALIAFHQPLLQSDLVDMVGSRAYEHVRELIDCALVRARQEGLSKRLTTTPEFPEYFGIPTTDGHEIRTYLAKKVGLEIKTPTGESALETFEAEDAADAPVEMETLVEDLEDAASGPNGGDVQDEATVDADAPADPESHEAPAETPEDEPEAARVPAVHSEAQV